jgi:hypothetical protein
MNPKLRKHEMLFVLGGPILTIADENQLRGVVADKPIEISESFSIGPRTPRDIPKMPQSYLNHSCQPNAGFHGQVFLVAMSSIPGGQEVRFDYGMVMHPNPRSTTCFTMDCQCGARNCRGKVTENDWTIPELQDRYDGYFQWFLQEKINRLRHRLT